MDTHSASTTAHYLGSPYPTSPTDSRGNACLTSRQPGRNRQSGSRGPRARSASATNTSQDRQTGRQRNINTSPHPTSPTGTLTFTASRWVLARREKDGRVRTLPSPHLPSPNRHPVFGKVIEGMDVVTAINT
eukprot:scaffold8996_cov32-Phaeocystis_antarctica.AAC.2